MASSLTTVPTDEVESLLQCSICLETFKDPRTLPCFHSFCRWCLENFVEGKQVLNYPVCRSEFTLNDQGVSGMNPNHFICNMLEMMTIQRQVKCIPCSHCQKPSVGRCVTCELFMCEQCFKPHDTYPGFLEDDLQKKENDIVRSKNQILSKVKRTLDKKARSLIDEEYKIFHEKQKAIDEDKKQVNVYFNKVKGSADIIKSLLANGNDEKIVLSQNLLRQSKKNVEKAKKAYPTDARNKHHDTTPMYSFQFAANEELVKDAYEAFERDQGSTQFGLEFDPTTGKLRVVRKCVHPDNMVAIKMAEAGFHA